MLSEEALEKLSERLVDRIEKLNVYMIRKLAKQILNIGSLTPSQLREVFQSIKYGSDLDEIIGKISEITNKNVKDIYNIFEEVAKKNQDYAKQFYEYRNIDYITYEKNVELKSLVRSLAEVTVNNYINISKTCAFAFVDSFGKIQYTSLSDIYQKITDEAILSITTGRETYQQVMKRTMKELSKQGMQDISYSNGYHRRMDSSVRMNIMEGVRTLQNTLQKKFGEEFGANGIEVMHHKNPAPDHSSNLEEGWFDIDGQQFSKEEFDNINSLLNRPVSTLNCYHRYVAIILGVNNPLFSENELKRDKEANIEGFEFEGKHYTRYEGTQLQRRLESKIRQYKDLHISASEMAKLDNDYSDVYKYQEKITQLTRKYKELCEIGNLSTKVERLKIEGYKRIRGVKDVKR